MSSQDHSDSSPTFAASINRSICAYIGDKAVKHAGAFVRKGWLRGIGNTLRLQCLRCGHFATLSPEVRSRLAIGPNTPIAAFVKRLRCPRCGSQNVLATRKPARPQKAS
jgi:hypothetical protein